MTEYVVTRWYRAPELLVENQDYTGEPPAAVHRPSRTARPAPSRPAPRRAALPAPRRAASPAPPARRSHRHLGVRLHPCRDDCTRGPLQRVTPLTLTPTPTPTPTPTLTLFEGWR